MALGQKIVAKAIIVLVALLCVNIVVKGCQPTIEKTEKRIQKVEQFMDRVVEVEEKADRTKKKIDSTGQKIKKFLLEPPSR